MRRGCCGFRAPPYLGVLEERRDARDVQAEAPRGAPRAVNAGSEERVVLLPRGRTSRARQRRNPQTQARAQLQASGKHRPAAGFLIPPRSGRHCSQAPPKKLKKLQLYGREEPRGCGRCDWTTRR